MKKLTGLLAVLAAAFCVLGAFAEDHIYSVSDASELVAALADVNDKAAARDTYVVTLAEGTYDLSKITAMHTVGLLMVTNKASTSAKFTLQDGLDDGGCRSRGQSAIEGGQSVNRRI